MSGEEVDLNWLGEKPFCSLSENIALDQVEWRKQIHVPVSKFLGYLVVVALACLQTPACITGHFLKWNPDPIKYLNMSSDVEVTTIQNC